jgi:hypothetical protein
MLRLNRPKPSFLPLRVLVNFMLSLWWAGGAVAETFFVAPHGNDANDCSSPARACASFQRGVDLCPVADFCSIHAAAGIYSQSTNVTNFKHVLILGPKDERGACIDRAAVKVESQIEHDPIFWVQDHATLRISCMRLEAREPRHCGFVSRQFAIGDLDDVDFGAFPGGCGVAAAETSKININNPGIYGNASRFATAADLSQVTVVGFVRIADFIKFDVAFLASITNSVVSFYPSGMEGGAHFSGASYQCSDASLNKTVVLPGGDAPYLATDDCTITGGHTIRSEIDGLRSEINSISSTQQGLRSEINSISSTLQGLRSEINSISSTLQGLHSQMNVEISTIRSEIDDVQHAQNVQRRLDRGIIAALALVLVLATGAAYYRLATRKK